MLFTLLALAILVVSSRTVGPLLAALALGILGLDAMASAFRRKPSLLSRIAPFPSAFAFGAAVSAQAPALEAAAANRMQARPVRTARFVV
ncbi:hypothetical protein [Cyanobium sp. NIES-981]|uniref:hypothetical protein n=1 Tax=Cyanobium sp. NIES-981 TaxID=1851505 RepID=UPI000B359622|nr:hypothetical protein [Cyanobium sp. NIES-981]